MPVGVVRCYKDALRYQSHHFTAHARPQPVVHDDEIQLGRMVFRVRKTLAASRDPYDAPSFTDEAATALPVGTPVYEVIGYSADRRLVILKRSTAHWSRLPGWIGSCGDC